MFNQYQIRTDVSMSHKSIKTLLTRYHYLGNTPKTPTNVICLVVNKKLMGVAIYGIPVGTRVQGKYSNKKTLELKRFVLHPKCPKNTGSWFLSKCHKLLTKKVCIISYADPNQGHEGTLYKASNFTYLGLQKTGTQYFQDNITKEMVSIRCVYQKCNGFYIKSALQYQNNRKSGLMSLVYMPRKHIYLFNK